MVRVFLEAGCTREEDGKRGETVRPVENNEIECLPCLVNMGVEEAEEGQPVKGVTTPVPPTPG